MRPIRLTVALGLKRRKRGESFVLAQNGPVLSQRVVGEGTMTTAKTPVQEDLSS